MSGITYLIDEKGKKKAAVVDLRQHGKLWEDFYDTLIVQARAGEPRESLDAVRKRLVARRKGNG